MLDIKFIRENPELVRDALKNKNRKPIDLDKIGALYEERLRLRGAGDELNRRRKEASEARNIEEGKKIKEESQKLEEELKNTERELHQLLIQIPNIPSPDTPIGPDESGNQVVRQIGEKPRFSFTPKAHWDLGIALDIIDNERAAKVSGARFTYIKGDLALMQFALIQLALGILSDTKKVAAIAEDFGVTVSSKPFIPIVPPVMVRPEVLSGMGRLDPPEDKYHLEKDDLYLVGSAEHSVGPMHMDEIIDEENLPLRYVGYSTAFRREAGSYGKDTKGILRMHQFDKIEMETFCLPEQSMDEQNLLVAVQEHLLQELGLPYQVVIVCTGDMGFPDQRQIDIETWMPGQDTYRETHSADLIGSFQPRRLNIRVRRKNGAVEYVHMNDATTLAIGRTLIAIMENNQEEDGSIRIPEVLRQYMGGKEKIKK
ncbi:MAG: serine--tRNA ligase [Parcubacteria group bacterium]|nr:serine--tRNA ligase [Parcubacteria group bacterium]MBI3074846.1 serine--tRNA ligase [Parcubacteria group bacterium]